MSKLANVKKFHEGKAVAINDMMESAILSAKIMDYIWREEGTGIRDFKPITKSELRSHFEKYPDSPEIYPPSIDLSDYSIESLTGISILSTFETVYFVTINSKFEGRSEYDYELGKIKETGIQVKFN
ncbi:hypothetical protein [Bacillus badius]|uniref:hypothetical protein n=1 Tax=Bacillus badius TaxID=1455 RepID=UPI0007B33F7E|nr:hypothetical protein [Bacillus badius]KZR59355.1 hypothetical protein A3781_13215 [Bacillus badius]